jgi:hypothetical protein
LPRATSVFSVSDGFTRGSFSTKAAIDNVCSFDSTFAMARIS